MKERPQVALVYPVASAYSFPVLRLIASSGEADLIVFFARRALIGRARHVEDASFGFPHFFLPDAGRVTLRRNVHTIDFNPTLPLELERRGVGLVIVSGYVQPTALLGIAWAKVRGRRYGIVSESHGLRSRGAIRSRLRRRLIAPVVRGADVLFATGRLAAAELSSFGGVADRVVIFPHVPDPNVFHPGDHPAEREVVRTRLGLPLEARMVAFVGRLVESKGIETLIEAHRIVRERTGAWLAVVGMGPLYGALTASAPEGVVFLGFQEPDAVASLLRAADLAVLPSLDEPWGTAALEAIACGCPVVATDRVASAVEFVERFGAGRLVPPGDAAALADAVSALLSAPTELAELAARTQSAAAEYTPEKAARSFLDGVRVALGTANGA